MNKFEKCTNNNINPYNKRINRLQERIKELSEEISFVEKLKEVSAEDFNADLMGEYWRNGNLVGGLVPNKLTEKFPFLEFEDYCTEGFAYRTDDDYEIEINLIYKEICFCCPYYKPSYKFGKKKVEKIQTINKFLNEKTIMGKCRDSNSKYNTIKNLLLFLVNGRRMKKRAIEVKENCISELRREYKDYKERVQETICYEEGIKKYLSPLKEFLGNDKIFIRYNNSSEKHLIEE